MNRKTFTAFRISGLILALTLSVVVPAEGQFQQIPGALQQVSVGADGAVWGINPTGSIYRYAISSQTWQSIPGTLTQIAVGAAGYVWGLNSAGQIYRYDTSTGNWDSIPGFLAQIAVGADGDTWGINGAGQIFHYITANQNWQYVAGTLSQISVGFDGAVWGLNPAGAVYRYNIGERVFEQLPGTLSQIEVGADGDVWGVDPENGIWHFNSLLQSWDLIAGRLSQISVGSATNVWGLDASDNIYNFNIQAQSWTQVPGSLKQISAGADGSFWGVNSVDSIYQFTRPPQSTQTWRPIPGVLAQVSVGPDGNLWGINTAQQIFHFNLLRQNWDFIPGSLSQIAVGFGGEVWGINSAQSIYRYDTSIGSWQYIPGQLAQIAVGANGDVWGINSGEYIYRFDRDAQAWQWIPGFLKQLSVGAHGAVWGINDFDQIFRYDQQSQGWDLIPGSLSQIAVGSSDSVWGINANGSIFHFDAGTQNWDWIPGNLSQIAVGFDGSVWGINSASQVFRFDPTAAVWNPVGGLLSHVAVGSDETVVGLNSSGAIFIEANPLASGPVFLPIPDSILNGLGQMITPIDLTLYIQGGTAPFTFTISSQTSSDVSSCSISTTQLSCDYSYSAGTNSVTVSVTDANNLTGKTTFNIIVTVPIVVYQVFGIDFSPYENGQDPNAGSEISVDQITRSLGILAPYTQNVRTFGVDHGLENIGCIAHKFGLKSWINAWINSDLNANETAVETLITLAKNGCVDVAIIGSEVLQRGDTSNVVLKSYLDEFRAAVPNVKVTTADTFDKLLAFPDVGNDCDFIFANYYPFWEGLDISLGIADLNAEDIQIRNTFPNKEVVVSETGWPSGGSPQGNAEPNLQNAAYYFLDFESWAQANGRKSFYFEFWDEAWKPEGSGAEGPVGPHWGIFNSDGTLKYGSDVFGGSTLPDNWTCNVAPGGLGTPSVAFTSVPPIGGTSLLQGQEYHVAPSDYYVAVYIQVGGGWWTKPTYAQPETMIQCDGSFSTNIVTGGNDASATQITAFVLPNTYSPPPQAAGSSSLPDGLSENAVASVAVTRE